MCAFYSQGFKANPGLEFANAFSVFNAPCFLQSLHSWWIVQILSTFSKRRLLQTLSVFDSSEKGPE